MEQEFYGSVERDYLLLQRDAITRMRSLIQRADPESALEAIKMYWQARGILPIPGKQSPDIINNVQQNSATIPLERQDAGNILELLKTMRQQTPPTKILEVTGSEV